jgi:hypothetical protein
VTSTPDAPEQATPQPPARPADGEQRPVRRQSVRGILFTMLVVGGFVAGIFALVPQPSSVRQPVVDVAEVARGNAAALGFTPSVPVGLDAGWTPTSALVQNGTDDVATWRVNYATPTGSWASLIQGGKATRGWEDTQIIDGTQRGTVVVDGRTWVVRARPDRGLTAYVLRGADVTTVVAGRAGRAELEILARATPLPGG